MLVATEPGILFNRELDKSRAQGGKNITGLVKIFVEGNEGRTREGTDGGERFDGLRDRIRHDNIDGDGKAVEFWAALGERHERRQRRSVPNGLGGSRFVYYIESLERSHALRPRPDDAIVDARRLRRVVQVDGNLQSADIGDLGKRLEVNACTVPKTDDIQASKRGVGVGVDDSLDHRSVLIGKRVMADFKEAAFVLHRKGRHPNLGNDGVSKHDSICGEHGYLEVTECGLHRSVGLCRWRMF